MVLNESRSQAARSVIITGATAGVGRATACYFAEKGWNVGLIARCETALGETHREIQSLGGRCYFEPADVADAPALHRAGASLCAALGGVDVWVNNAMATVFSRFENMTAEEFHRVTAVTYLGVVNGTRTALALMNGRGLVVQVGSALAYRGIPLQSAYCGAKHAIKGFSDALRSELLQEGSKARISIVQLPAVDTPQFDWARAKTPFSPRPAGEEIFDPLAAASAIYTAAARPRREYFLGAITLKTAVGSMIAPGILDRRLVRLIKGQQTTEPLARPREGNLLRPVQGLHRMRGSFGVDAKTRGLILSGFAARSSLIGAGTLLLLLLGALLGRAF